MRKFYLIGFLFFISWVQTHAQRFGVTANAGWGQPIGDHSKGGLLFSIEPSYKFMGNGRLGVRLQMSQLVRGLEKIDVIEYERTPTYSYVITFQYEFRGDKNIKPFTGIGLGLYNIGRVSSVIRNDLKYEFVKSVDKLGFFIRAGANIKKIILTFDYNLIPKTSENIILVPPIYRQDIEVVNSYLGMTVGYLIGK